MECLLTPLSIKRLLYLLLVAGVALFFNHNIITAAMILALVPARDTRFRSLRLLFLVGLIAALATVLASYAAYNVWVLAFYLLIITLGAAYLAQRYPHYALPLFLINFLTLLASKGSPDFTAFYDGLFILAGTAIAMIAQLVLWPYFMRNRLQACLVLALRDLMQVNKDIFACLLQPEYATHVYLFERRLHVQKDKYVHSMQCLHAIIQRLDAGLNLEKKTLLEAFYTHVNRLYKIMMDYSQIRWRVTDHSTFAVCAPELQALLNEMNDILSEAVSLFSRQHHQLHTARLSEKISKLEENYHNVLQVAAREPLVFLLFIASLKAFDEQIATLRETGLAVRTTFLWHT